MGGVILVACINVGTSIVKIFEHGVTYPTLERAHLIGEAGFEPAKSSSQTRNLRPNSVHTPATHRPDRIRTCGVRSYE